MLFCVWRFLFYMVLQSLQLYLIGERFSSVKSYIALVIETVCVWIAGIIPSSVHPLIALFPVFILNAYQWQTFTTPECYNSSTIFSTNNYKQTVLAWMRYHMTHDQFTEKTRMAFYRYTNFLPSRSSCRIFCSKARRNSWNMVYIRAAHYSCLSGASDW